ncbi:MAG: response regulator transcription factor [Verrucomicrobiota bacterium]
MKNIRVLLADDHALIRAGIRSLLEKLPAVAVIAEAGDGREALALVKKHRPTVVLMDIAMPELNGLEAVARITKDFPGVKVIILSMHVNEEYVRQAFRAGASGYLLKDGTLAEMEMAIEAARSGGTFLSPRISKRVIDSYFESAAKNPSPLEHLTSRQREILQLIAEGKSTKEIAFLLGLSVKTIETHRAKLMAKLDIHDVPGLVRYAMHVGLVPPELPPD